MVNMFKTIEGVNIVLSNKKYVATFTLAYDSQGYLDIYYLISPNGKILYENGPLEATLPELLSEINRTVGI